MADELKLKIISDGTGRGTKIIDEATGRRLFGVRSFKYEICGPGEIVNATLELFNVDLEGKLKIQNDDLEIIELKTDEEAICQKSDSE